MIPLTVSRIPCLLLMGAVSAVTLCCASAQGRGPTASLAPVSGAPTSVLSAASTGGSNTAGATSSVGLPRTTTAVPAEAEPPKATASAQSEPTSQELEGLSVAEAHSIAEREVRRLGEVFQELSLESPKVASGAYHFGVKGRSPDPNGVRPLGELLVDGNGAVAFQDLDNGDAFSVKESVHRERKKRQAVAAVYRLPEVRSFCKINSPRCVHFVERAPEKGCVLEGTDRRRCAWNISIRTLQGAGTDSPHVTSAFGFYVRENGELFVEPIETGEVVRLEVWRCLRRHDFDAAVCPDK